MSRFRPRFTYANVISTICLIMLVGGGTAFAASQLEKESVGSKQLKKEAVTPAKLSAKAKATLTGPAGPVGPKGATGATGPAGPAGAPGTSAAVSTELVSAVTANDTTTPKETAAACPSGTVLSGGYVLNSNGNPGVVLRTTRSYAPDTGTWLVRAVNSGNAENWALTVVAVCKK